MAILLSDPMTVGEMLVIALLMVRNLSYLWGQ